MAKVESSKEQSRWKRKGGGDFAPFWSPWKDKKQPREIIGVCESRKLMKGKFGERLIVTVKQEGTGEGFALDCKKAGLKGLDEIGDGQTIRVVYLGEKKVKGRKQPMHDIELYEETA